MKKKVNRMYSVSGMSNFLTLEDFPVEKLNFYKKFHEFAVAKKNLNERIFIERSGKKIFGIEKSKSKAVLI